MQGGFVVSDIVFGCDDPTHNSSNSPGAWPNLVLSQPHETPVFQIPILQGGFVNLDIFFGCDNLTYKPRSV